MMTKTHVGTKYNQGDIVLLPFPYSDLTEARQRPALIISNASFNASQDRICCLITTAVRQKDIGITKQSLKGGSLPFKSYVRPYRIFTVHTSIIKKRIAKVTRQFHETVVESLFKEVK